MRVASDFEEYIGRESMGALIQVPALIAQISQSIEGIRNEQAETRRQIAAMFEKQDKAREKWEVDHRWTISQIKWTRGFIAGIILLGGALWGFLFSTNHDFHADTDKFQSDTQTALAKINDRLSKATYVPEGMDEFRNAMMQMQASQHDQANRLDTLTGAMHELQTAIIKKTPPKFDLHVSPTIINQKPDQSRASKPSGFFNDILHPHP